MNPNEVTLYDETDFAEDPLHRKIKVAMFLCPCGKPIDIFVTKESQFTMEPENPKTTRKAWHYDVSNGKISISPSIDLAAFAGHPPQCHFFITGWNLVE